MLHENARSPHDGDFDPTSGERANGRERKSMRAGRRERKTAAPGSRLLETATVAGLQAAEIASHMSTLVEIQIDRARAAARRRIAIIAAWTVAIVAFTSAAIAAGVRLVAGMAGAFTQLFDGVGWAGDLTAGVVGVVLLALGAMLAWKVLDRVHLRRSAKKYAARRRRHVLQFGGSHGEQAAPSN